MQMVPISDETMAQLAEYADRRGQDTAEALDAALTEYLLWQQNDYQEAIEGILEGFEDMKANRTQSVSEMFEDLCEKHGLPH